jgi:hypothetical protein
MGRFLLVELEPNLASFGTTHNAAFLSVQHVNGVRQVVDLSAITTQTLEGFLRSEPPPVAQRPKGRKPQDWTT